MSDKIRFSSLVTGQIIWHFDAKVPVGRFLREDCEFRSPERIEGFLGSALTRPFNPKRDFYEVSQYEWLFLHYLVGTLCYIPFSSQKLYYTFSVFNCDFLQFYFSILLL